MPVIQMWLDKEAFRKTFKLEERSDQEVESAASDLLKKVFEKASEALREQIEFPKEDVAARGGFYPLFTLENKPLEIEVHATKSNRWMGQKGQLRVTKAIFDAIKWYLRHVGIDWDISVCLRLTEGVFVDQ